MTDKPVRLCRVCKSRNTKFVWCFDDADKHAHNVFACNACGVVEIERVWHNAGITLVTASGHTSEIET